VSAPPRCGAKTRAGHPCGEWAMKGQTRCRLHGGKTPNSLKAAKRRLDEAAAVTAVRKAGVSLEAVADPVQLLRELASEAVALKEFFQSRLEALEELRYQAGAGEQLRAEVALYERALDRAERFAHDLAKLNLGERRVQLDEAKVVLIAAVLQRVLEAPELALDAFQQGRARTLLIEALEDA